MKVNVHCESEDGITRTAPALGIVEDQGSMGNNIIQGGKLHINASTQAGGLVRVAVRSGDGAADGDWLEGWNFEHGAPFTGDATVGWPDQENFRRLEDRSIRLHCWLQKADLYSFGFAD